MPIRIRATGQVYPATWSAVQAGSLPRGGHQPAVLVDERLRLLQSTPGSSDLRRVALAHALKRQGQALLLEEQALDEDLLRLHELGGLRLDGPGLVQQLG